MRRALCSMAVIIGVVGACGGDGPGTTTTPPTSATPPETEAAPILRWISNDGQVVLDGGVFLPGKNILMEEVRYQTAPEQFEVFEIYGSFLDFIIARHGELRPLDASAFEAEEVEDGVSRSVRAWNLPVPSQLRGKSRYLFTDDHGVQSGVISSSNLGEVDVTVEVDAESPDIPGFSTTFSGELFVSGTILIAVDPDIRLVIMVPWGSGEADLTTYVEELLSDLEGAQPDVNWPDVGEEIRQPFLPAEPPEGWTVQLSEESFFGLSPGEVVEFEAFFNLPTSGSSLFAVKVIDIDDPTRFVVSNLFGLASLEG